MRCPSLARRALFCMERLRGRHRRSVAINARSLSPRCGLASTLLFRRLSPPRLRILIPFSSTIVDVANALDTKHRGVPVHFLNRPPIVACKKAADLDAAFATPPSGYTPLERSMTALTAAGAAAVAETGMLLIVLTDGA